MGSISADTPYLFGVGNSMLGVLDGKPYLKDLPKGVKRVPEDLIWYFDDKGEGDSESWHRVRNNHTKTFLSRAGASGLSHLDATKNTSVELGSNLEYSKITHKFYDEDQVFRFFMSVDGRLEGLCLGEDKKSLVTALDTNLDWYLIEVDNIDREIDWDNPDSLEGEKELVIEDFNPPSML